MERERERDGERDGGRERKREGETKGERDHLVLCLYKVFFFQVHFADSLWKLVGPSPQILINARCTFGARHNEAYLALQ